jgi:hypothetical protein
MLPPVIVDDTNVVGLAFRPAEHDAQLLVDSNAVKSPPSATQGLESIARRRAKVQELVRSIQHIELPQSRRSDIGWKATRSSGPGTVVEVLRCLVAERRDHVRRY